MVLYSIILKLLKWFGKLFVFGHFRVYMIIIVWSLSVILGMAVQRQYNSQYILYIVHNRITLNQYSWCIYFYLIPQQQDRMLQKYTQRLCHRFTLMFMTGPCTYYRNDNLRKLCKFTFETFKQRVLYILFSNVISKQ